MLGSTEGGREGGRGSWKLIFPSSPDRRQGITLLVAREGELKLTVLAT